MRWPLVSTLILASVLGIATSGCVVAAGDDRDGWRGRDRDRWEERRHDRYERRDGRWQHREPAY